MAQPEGRPARTSRSLPALVAVAGQVTPVAELETPLPLERLAPGIGPWELEIGFGKGWFLLRECARRPRTRFLGIEVSSPYFRRVARRTERNRLRNVVLVRGEALYLLATVLPEAFADAVHVYFPDPWPKSRHHKRRLLDPETVDLVLARLVVDGVLYFATDHLDYGEAVTALLGSHPRLAVTAREQPWDDGPRTHYERKYLRDQRPIVRLEARLRARDGAALHPVADAVLVAPRRLE